MDYSGLLFLRMSVLVSCVFQAIFNFNQYLHKDFYKILLLTFLISVGGIAEFLRLADLDSALIEEHFIVWRVS